MSGRSRLLCCLFLLGYVQECWQLAIKNVNIPAIVKAQTDYVILDCDYDLENTSSTGLVVKWFFNDKEVVYQWIYGRNPLAGEIVSKYIDLKYRASDDPYTMYRAIKFNKPDIELTGEYKCVISTFADEEMANATMVVYSYTISQKVFVQPIKAAENKFNISQTKKTVDEEDGVEIVCFAVGLYPQPTLDVSVEGVPEVQMSKAMATQREDGCYDISSQTTLLEKDLPEATGIKCLLGIPRVNYSNSLELIYYSGNFTARRSINVLLLLVHLAFLAVYNL